MTDEDRPHTIEEALHLIAEEVARSFERLADVDLERWFESLSGLAREQATHTSPFGSAQPHPLDLPTEEQGLALAALESGRWTLEPGTDALGMAAEGPAPRDALGLVRELRVRDWITAEGALTVAGRSALGRWLDRA